MTDGSIKIDTKIDSSGLVEGLKRMFTKFDGSMRDLVVSSKTGIERVKEVFKNTFQKIGSTVKNAFGGIKNAGSKINNMLEILGNVGSMAFRRIIQFIQICIKLFGTLIGITVALAAVLAAVVIFAIRKLLDWAQKMTDTLYKNLSVTSAMRDRVVQLKGAFNSLKGSILAMGATLLNALAPVIMKIIDWLVKAINWVSMFIAALTGQQTVMQYVSGAVDQAAEATGNLAENTENAEKAAKGALAAFDELNVLETKDKTPPVSDGGVTGGGGVAGGSIIMAEVEVPENFIENLIESVDDWLSETIVNPIADWITQAILNITDPEWWRGLFVSFSEWVIRMWNGLIEWITDAWNDFDTWFREKTQPLADWFKNKVTVPINHWFRRMTENIQRFFTNAFKGIKDLAIQTWKNIKDFWSSAYSWFRTQFNNIKDAVERAFIRIRDSAINVWNRIKAVYSAVSTWFRSYVTEPIKRWFTASFDAVRTKATSVWTSIRTVWYTASEWFRTNVTDKLKTIFSTALESIKNKFTTIFDDIKTSVRNVLNSIIGFINTLLRAFTSGINTIIRALNSLNIQIPDFLGGGTVGLNIPTITDPQIPYLAKGAVIPPNSTFAAVLGDQRAGKNLEAPEGLIRQIIQDELGYIQADISIKFDGTLGSLVRELKPYIDKENIRIGGSLIKRSLV